MNRSAWWTCALLALSVARSQARVYSRCELARELRELGVHPDHISTWVCIAYHESRFDTAANNPHSGDHGIFQISELYWCGAGKACGLPCAALRDDDIADDLECALTVHEEHTRLQGDGFLAWVVYPQHCKQSTKKYLVDCNENFKNGSATNEGRAFNDYVPYSRGNRYKTIPAVRTYTNNPNIDNLLPPYLAITSIFRGSYGKVLDHNKINGVDWYNYKYDNVDELRLPEFGVEQLPDSTTTTTTTTTTPSTTTPYVPRIKTWRFIETNQFRKKVSSPDKTAIKTTTEDNSSVKNSLSYSTYKPRTGSTTRESLASESISDTSPKVINKIDSYKTPMTLNSTVKSTNITDTTYKLPAYTAVYKSLTTTYRPSTAAYASSTESTNNYMTSTSGYKSPSSTTTVKPAFPSFVFTFPTTTSKPKTISTTAFTFPPWAFRNQKITTSTVKPSTSTYKPTTSRIQTPWYTFTSRYNTHGSSKTLTPENTKSSTTATYRQTTKLYSSTSTQKPPITKSTQIPYFFTSSTTQRPTLSSTQKPVTLATTLNSAFFTTSTTQKPSFFKTIIQNPTSSATSTTQKPFFSFSTTRKPTTPQKPAFFTTSTTQNPKITTLSSQQPTTRKTSRITQNIFDLYLNPTKPPQLPSYSFSRDNKSKLNIFSGGTTTVSPSAKNKK